MSHKHCICAADNDWSKCPFPEALTTVVIQSFKDEPDGHLTLCPYQKYTGSTYFDKSQFTREEYGKLMFELTLCAYEDND